MRRWCLVVVVRGTPFCSASPRSPLHPLGAQVVFVVVCYCHCRYLRYRCWHVVVVVVVFLLLLLLVVVWEVAGGVASIKAPSLLLLAVVVALLPLLLLPLQQLHLPLLLLLLPQHSRGTAGLQAPRAQ